MRNKKCEDLSFNKKDKVFQDYDREIWDCLKETSKEVASLEKMKETIRVITQNQAVLWFIDCKKSKRESDLI